MSRTDRGERHSSEQHQLSPQGPDRKALETLVAPASPAGLELLASAIGNRAFTEAIARHPTDAGKATGAGRRPRAGSGGAPLQRAVLARSKPDVVLEEDTVHGDVWFDDVESRMVDVETRLAANAANYGVLVLQACEHFGALADRRIESVAGEITGEQLAEALVGAALTVVMGQLTGQIASAAFKAVVGQAGRRVTDQIKQETRSAASNEDDVDALKGAIVAIELKVLDAGTRMTSEAQAWLPEELKPVYAKCRARAELDSGEHELVEPFIDLPPDLINDQIEHMYGIPSVTSAKVVQIEVFRGLVEEFARIELRTTTKGARKSIEMGFGTGSQTLGGQATEAAQWAAGERALALEATWVDFARAGRSYKEAAACGVPLPAEDEHDRARG